MAEAPPISVDEVEDCLDQRAHLVTTKKGRIFENNFVWETWCGKLITFKRRRDQKSCMDCLAAYQVARGRGPSSG